MDKLSNGFVCDTVDSTMDEASRLIQKGEHINEGSFVFARKQEASRGRRGRAWQSISGNCHVSFFIEVRQEDPPIQTLSFLSALVLRDAIMSYARSADALKFKWPNDVLWNGQKVGGILLEKAPVCADSKEWMILGIGLNLVDSPSKTSYPVSSVRAFSGQVVRPLMMVEKIRHELLSRLAVWREVGAEKILQEWLQFAYCHQHMVSVSTEAEGTLQNLQGRFEGIDLDGALLLRKNDGNLCRLTSGDLFFNLTSLEVS